MRLQSIDNDGIRTLELFVQWALSLAWTLGTLVFLILSMFILPSSHFCTQYLPCCKWTS